MLDAYWTLSAPELLAALRSRPEGLTSAEAEARLREAGPDAARRQGPGPALEAVLTQVRNPLSWLLLFAAVVSFAVGSWVDGTVVLGILLLGSVLGGLQELRANQVVARLRARIGARAQVLRDGVERTVESNAVVPGDVLVLCAGTLVAADGVLLEARDFFASEAALTGESLPAEKSAGPSPRDAPLGARHNVVFQGTNVRSGTARAVAVRTGKGTEFGAVAARLAQRPPETDFDHGLHRFGYLLTRVMGALVLVVFAADVLRAKPPLASLLFAIALAVGLAPEMLPAILSIMLSRGARAMAARGVVVRRLSAIENLGSMDVLCTDKTGTLTEGTVRLERAVDAAGLDSPAVLRLAYYNAALESGLANALDDAVRERGKRELPGPLPRKLDEVPYDFQRKRMSVAIEPPEGGALLVSKGALERVLEVCDRVRLAAGGAVDPLDDAGREALRQRFLAWSAEGVRVLGVATRSLQAGLAVGRADERAMVFEGFLLFLDPPRADAGAAVRELLALGVEVKVITGDQVDVTRHLAAALALPVRGVLTGGQLAQLSDEALWQLAERTTLFAEVDPNQKERIILALRHRGHVVGYLGDGINDAPALHAADVGISVDTAVDVAREAADFVLLRRDLGTLSAGIAQGRTTFANTMKYLLTVSSANFGNMLSMAAASAVLPFLPLLAPQVLLNNFLSDVPAMTLAGDSVDPEQLASPLRWDLTFLRRFMLLFGALSALFDGLTFAALMLLVHATPEAFRTGWFVESLATQLLVALVVRTRRRFWRSRPGRGLLVSTAAMLLLALALPYSPLARPLGMVPLAPQVLALLVSITLSYVGTVEILKRRLFARLRAMGER